MKIVCCSNMPYAREAFSTLGDVLSKDGRAIRREDLMDAVCLATRSTTQVNRELLEGTAVRFVGTATIGTDHMDLEYLQGRGVQWCFAPGCNANSVAEYVAAALLRLATRHGFRLHGKTIGVVGVGNVGSLVARRAEALGLRVLRNDPPRQRAMGAAGQEFVSLDRVLAESDIVTLHVPLTREGEDRTFQMADESFFQRLKPGAIFINAARGPVVRTDSLLGALGSGRVSHAVIDTWEGEPAFRPDLLQRVDLATPHIAGHSFEGKAMGTVMVYREACRFLGVPAAWRPDALLPAPVVPHIELDAAGMTDEEALWALVRQVYDIEADDARMRKDLPADTAGRAARFDALRKNYPMRREFRFTQVALRNAAETLQHKVRDLGFAAPGAAMATL